MNIEIRVPDSLNVDPVTVRELKSFIQMMANRIAVGDKRYGKPEARKKYLTRIKKELGAYIDEGNTERLVNVANYCLLESNYPERKDTFFDATAESATRGKV